MNRAGEMPPNRRWLDWNPTERILADLPQTEPTKPSQPGFVGFVGSLSVTPAEIADSSNEDTGSSPKRVAKPIGSVVDSAIQRERVMSWYAWKAAALNRMFLEQGAAGQSGRITAGTIEHGLQTGTEDGSGRMSS
jgi:hypothetical protein